MFFFQKNTGGCFCGKFRGGKRQVNKTGNMKFVSRASATSKNVFCVFFDDVLVCAHLFFLTLARAGNASFARARALGCAHRTPGARTQRVSLAPHTLTPPPRAHTHTTALAHYIHLSHSNTFKTSPSGALVASACDRTASPPGPTRFARGPRVTGHWPGPARPRCGSVTGR